MFTISSAFLSGSQFLLLCFFCDTRLSKAVFLHAFFFSRRSERKKLSGKEGCREEEEGGGRSLRRCRFNISSFLKGRSRDMLPWVIGQANLFGQYGGMLTKFFFFACSRTEPKAQGLLHLACACCQAYNKRYWTWLQKMRSLLI